MLKGTLIVMVSLPIMAAGARPDPLDPTGWGINSAGGLPLIISNPSLLLIVCCYSNWQYLRHGLKKFCYGMFWKNSPYLNEFFTDSHETWIEILSQFMLN
jgi:hypothetical protein